MLQTQTIEPRAFSLLIDLNNIPQLKEAGLVGGTALSLYFGHRISDDLDFFCINTFDSEKIVTGLKEKFGKKFKARTVNPRVGIFSFVDEVKIDIVYHPHVMLQPFQEIEGLRFFSKEDIIAMKIQAILGRGKKKDFWDIAELLQHYTVQDFIDFHSQKFANQFLLISVPQAMIYFSDAEEDEDPVSLKGQTWDSVKSIISKKVRKFLS